MFQFPETSIHVRAPVNFDAIQERLLPFSKLQSHEELSPFPNVCKHLQNQYRETTHQNSNNIGSNEQQSCVLVRPEVHDKVENIQIAQLCNKPSGSSFVVARTELVEPIRQRTTDNKNTLIVNKIQISRTEEFPEDNSLVIRDRNSNVYALQSQNVIRVKPKVTAPNLNLPTSCEIASKIAEEKVFGNEERNNYVIGNTVEGYNKLKSKGFPQQKCIGKVNKYSVDSIVTERSEDWNGSCLPPVIVDDQRNIPNSASDTMKANETNVARNGTSLQCCPLCQLKFDSGLVYICSRGNF